MAQQDTKVLLAVSVARENTDVGMYLSIKHIAWNQFEYFIVNAFK